MKAYNSMLGSNIVRGQMAVKLLLAVSTLLAIAGCKALNGSGSNAAPTISQAGSPCTITDQDAYVWRPARLQFLQSCVRVTGVVMDLSAEEPDGDVHIDLRVDAPYQALLTTGNLDTDGYLTVEAICLYIPPSIEVLRLCASDADPFSGPLPHTGDRVWIEGRYVLDLWHGSQAELHPLYHWGSISP